MKSTKGRSAVTAVQPCVQLSLAISEREPEAADEAAMLSEKLRAAGYAVLNPFEMCGGLPREMFDELEYWWLCVRVCCESITGGKVDVLAVSSERYSYGVGIEHAAALRSGFVFAKAAAMYDLYIHDDNVMVTEHLDEIARIL